MAAPNNLTTTLNSIGNREDLSDTIDRVAAEETPVYSALSRTKASARFHEWQTEGLANPAVNAQLEGDDVGTLDAPNLTPASATTARLPARPAASPAPKRLSIRPGASPS